MTQVGVTLGVEEEYHLVDPRTWGLADAPEVTRTAIEVLGADAQGEISTSQLEIATPVCSTLGEVRDELTRLRKGAVEAAAAHGCLVLAAGTHPTATWKDQRLSQGVRYVELLERWGILALQQLIAGCHVHVSVPDPELAVQVLDRLRPDLPVLLAMSGSSPYWEGTDTRYASYRTQWFARWPVTGSPEHFGSRASYDGVVADLVAAGLIRDASHLYWDARPSTTFPTVEVRVADTMPVLDDVVLHAGLVRSLVRVGAAEAESGRPAVQPRAELVRAARWRAAKQGLQGTLIDLRNGGQQSAPDAVHTLLARLRDDLERHGEWAEVCALADDLLARGTSAVAQRALAERAGDLDAVTKALTDQMARG